MNLKESNIGGEGGIRTLGRFDPTPDFESGDSITPVSANSGINLPKIPFIIGVRR